MSGIEGSRELSKQLATLLSIYPDGRLADMDIVGDRRFVEIPGDRLHELPPLMVRSSPAVKRLDKVMDMANDIVQSEELLAEAALQDWPDGHEAERRKMDLAVNLVEQYMSFVTQWQWGDSILDWIRHCETQFQITHDLRMSYGLTCGRTPAAAASSHF
jgi:hypothetical protein